MKDLPGSAFTQMIELLNQAYAQQRQIEDAMKQARHLEQRLAADRQRAADGLLSVQRAIETFDQLKLSTVAEQVTSLARMFDQREQMLRFSVQPFPDVSVLARSLIQQTEVFEAFDRLNRRIADATLVGTVDLDGDASEWESDAIAAEKQLVEVVPGEALDALKQVRFEPFSLLSVVTASPTTLYEITPRAFEQFVAELVSRLGIDDVVLTPEKADGGRDVIGTKRILGIPIIFAFECKRYLPGNPVGVSTARALLGTISHGHYRADRGVLVTTSRFTKPARQFIVTSPRLEGRDFDGVLGWLHELSGQRVGPSDAAT